MPTYEYHCDTCENNFDVKQSFHDDPLTECPTCGSPVRKVFGNVGIVFKGSGFYKTDSRDGGKGKAASATEPSPTTSKEGSGSSDKAEGSSGPSAPEASSPSSAEKSDKGSTPASPSPSDGKKQSADTSKNK